MKYVFILGRNVPLSVLEVKSYLKKKGNPILRSSLVSHGFLVEVKDKLDSDAIAFLGGVLAIGEVMASGEMNALLNDLDDMMVYDGTSSKLTYTFWEFSHHAEEMLDYLKQKFKGGKLKAGYKGLTGKMKMQDETEVFIPSSKRLTREYFIFDEHGREHFGIITQQSDYEALEERDMQKPVRRESLAISPRLAKIMLNLSGAKPGDTVIDPFCGIGVILAEALLQDMKGIGIDVDAEAVKGAGKNLQWMGFSEDDYELVHGNSKELEIPRGNVLVSEPDLGEVLKKIPTKERAKRILLGFDRLLIDVLHNMVQYIEGNIVVTTPYIRIGKKRLKCNIERICDRVGLEVVGDGVPEYRHNQVVGRMIYVLRRG